MSDGAALALMSGQDQRSDALIIDFAEVRPRAQQKAQPPKGRHVLADQSE
jgi:hypothetical protein